MTRETPAPTFRTMSDSPTREPMRQQVEEYIVSLQNTIVSAFEGLDPSAPPSSAIPGFVHKEAAANHAYSHVLRTTLLGTNLTLF